MRSANAKCYETSFGCWPTILNFVHFAKASRVHEPSDEPYPLTHRRGLCLRMCEGWRRVYPAQPLRILCELYQARGLDSGPPRSRDWGAFAFFFFLPNELRGLLTLLRGSSFLHDHFCIVNQDPGTMGDRERVGYMQDTIILCCMSIPSQFALFNRFAE